MEESAAHRCIFCLKTDGGFKKEAHIIPESACNEDVVLPEGCECDRCNNAFSVIRTRVRIQTETYGLAITLDSARC